ncbi:MFS transporter [Streptomyces sp. NPDC002851]
MRPAYVEEFGPRRHSIRTSEERTRRVRRAYLLVSGLDHFADMLLAVTSVLLLQSLGMGSGGVFALFAAVWIVEGLSELPTGILADMCGRRASVTVSFVLRGGGYGALFFSDSLAVAAAGTLLAAFGGTFASGALEAWAVDESGRREPGALDRLFAGGKIAENAGMVLGTTAGAALGSVGLALPQLAAGCACVVSAVLALALMSGRRRGQQARPTGPFLRRLRDSGAEVAAGARLTLRGDRILVALMTGSGLLWLCRGIPGVQWQIVYEGLAGGHLMVLALMRSISSLLEIPLLGLAMSVQRRGRAGRRTVLRTAALTGALALAAAAVATVGRDPVVSVSCYIVFCTAFGLCVPGIRAALNERVDGAHRATVLSVASLFNALFTGCGLVIAGSLVGDLGAVGATWPLAAVGTAAMGLWLAKLAARPVAAGRPVAEERPVVAAPPVVAGWPLRTGAKAPAAPLVETPGSR